MPLIVFNFQSSNAVGTTTAFSQTISLKTLPPPNARFFIRQVSASTASSFASAFKYIRVYIPVLMTDTDRTIFQEMKLDSAGDIVPASIVNPGLRYYMTDSISEPFAVNAFPNLSLGRHELHSHEITLYLTAVGPSNDIASLTSYSIVIEWDSE